MVAYGVGGERLPSRRSLPCAGRPDNVIGEGCYGRAQMSEDDAQPLHRSIGGSTREAIPNLNQHIRVGTDRGKGLQICE
jgi:hypothetical protein